MKISHQRASKFAKLITLDTRSLGVFRIMLGLTILLDLYIRAKHLELFYTNEGVFQIKPGFVWLNHLSLHTFSGEAEYITLLFWIAACFAVLLIIGFLTPVVQPICWFLLISLHARNTYVLNDGDTLLRLIMFISIFLPIGARFSADALLFKKWTTKVEDNYYSAWTLAFIFQLIILYAVSGWAKFTKIWHSGQGIYYTMMSHTYAKSTSKYLLNTPFVMTLLTYFTLLLERFGWFLLLFSSRTQLYRLIAVVLFISFHFGLFLFMELGIFPLVAIVAWIALIPSFIWDKYLPQTAGLKNVDAQNQSNGLIGLLFKKNSWRSLTIQCFGVLAITLNIYHNFDLNDHSFVKIKPFDFLIEKLYLDQGWRVFTGPATSDGWYVIEATLADGESIDLLKQEWPLNWEKPQVVSEEYKTHRQRKFIGRIRDNIYYQKQLILYLSNKWNESHEPNSKIVSATYWYLEEQILPDRRYSDCLKIKKFELKQIE